MVPRRLAALLAAAVLTALRPPAQGAEIAPHRALYALRLAKVDSASGVIGAKGAMEYEWGETCGGWTVEQRYLLRMRYVQSPSEQIQSNLVTWEAKDGLHYRFNDREVRNGKVTSETSGTARLDGPGLGGIASFTKPRPLRVLLPPGALFPSAHTLLLIHAAEQGRRFLVRKVFDGAAEEGAVDVSAVIGPKLVADRDASPLLRAPGWNVRLAFFPAKKSAELPDYELGMHLLENGVSRSMLIDYAGYAIAARLEDIEELPRPHC